MTAISIFYQGEGIPDIEHLEADGDETLASIKAAILKKHGLAADSILFLEDSDDAADEKRKLREYATRAGVKIHVHRCRKVEASVTFNNETVRDHFGAGVTIAHVKKWAAERKFGMTPQEAGEHVLQISGTQERPDPGTHLGRFVQCPKCAIAFDLVPNERINGAPLYWGQR
jgi:hypothetical protein